VRRQGLLVRCFTRGGHDWADRFSAIVEAARRVKASSFLIDGEAIICRPDGLSDFAALRAGRRGDEVMLAAFDLIELEGDDLRDEPLERRKRRLEKLLPGRVNAIAYNEHSSQPLGVAAGNDDGTKTGAKSPPGLVVASAPCNETGR
jgi:bifunctional non-homologous end joining protein LigD